jgi:hypothetical protein
VLTAVGITNEEINETQENTITTFQKLRDKVLSPLVMQPQLPNVAPIQTTQASVWIQCLKNVLTLQNRYCR